MFSTKGPLLSDDDIPTFMMLFLDYDASLFWFVVECDWLAGCLLLFYHWLKLRGDQHSTIDPNENSRTRIKICLNILYTSIQMSYT